MTFITCTSVSSIPQWYLYLPLPTRSGVCALLVVELLFMLLFALLLATPMAARCHLNDALGDRAVAWGERNLDACNPLKSFVHVNGVAKEQRAG